MASEVAESSSGSSSSRMDLNLYLGLSPLPRPRGRDIGLELALACSSPPPPQLPLLEAMHEPLSATAVDSAYPAQHTPSNSFPVPEQLPIDTLLAFDIEYGDLEGPNDDSVNVIQPVVLPLDPSSDISSPLPHIGVPLPPLTEMAADELPVPGGSTHGPRLPLSPPALAIRQQESEAAANAATQMVPNPLRIPATSGDLQEQREACLEFRLQRLIQVSNRYDIGRLPDQRDASPETDRLIGDIMRSQSCLEASRKRKLGLDDKIAGDGKGEGDCECGADFECNICFDSAKEPVVTPCGHLFCWPCLYQWLHRHSEHSECPVCKGEVLEVNVTPIYGRGGGGGRDDSSSDVPPRPHVQQNEGLKQQQLQRTLLRRSGENMTTLTRWIDEQAQQQEARVEGNGSAHIPASYDAVHPLMIPWTIRHNAFRRRRDERSGARGNVQAVQPLRQEAPNTSDSGSEESGHNQPFQLSVTIDAQQGPPRRAAQPSSSADRTSTSSTMAVIEGDVATPMGDLTEPNIAASAGSTRSRRRRVQ